MKFFSCDWGTSTFRLRLVNAGNATVLSAIKTGDGIAAVFESWKQTKQSEKNRMAFYQAYLFDQIKKLTGAFNSSSENVPVIISGMATSSIGMLELPYKELPFACDGSALITHCIPNEELHNKIILISGARSASDVMRGEETILMGCNNINSAIQKLFIFPGTHSKHIMVKSGVVQNFNTYMTGELFDLLSKKSILATSVKKNDAELDINNRNFVDGVIKGAKLNLLNSIFHVRTNRLFDKLTPQENYRYLSGLLIGYELKDVAENKTDAITLVCSAELKNEYLLALEVLGLNRQLNYENADEALVNGQCKILKQQGCY